jgi:hypothetical protein
MATLFELLSAAEVGWQKSEEVGPTSAPRSPLLPRAVRNSRDSSLTKQAS